MDPRNLVCSAIFRAFVGRLCWGRVGNPKPPFGYKTLLKLEAALAKSVLILVPAEVSFPFASRSFGVSARIL